MLNNCRTMQDEIAEQRKLAQKIRQATEQTKVVDAIVTEQTQVVDAQTKLVKSHIKRINQFLGKSKNFAKKELR